MPGHNTTTEVAALPKTCTADTDRARLLIDAAGELLAENGLEGLTIRAVLRRTGLARRAFYECFAGKDDLVLAVFGQTLRAGAVHFREQAKPVATPLDKIKVVVVGLVTGAIANDQGFGEQRVRAMVHEHLRLAETRPDELQAALQPLLDFIAEQVTEGIRIGQLRESHPVLQATLIYNLVATTLHTMLLMPQDLVGADQRREQLADEMWEFCRRAIIV